MIDVGTVVASGGVNAVIGIAVYFLVRRNVERVDRLEGELKTLRDERVVDLGKKIDANKVNFDERMQKASEARGKLHEQIEAVRIDYQTRADCQTMHKEFGEFRAAVARLEAMQSRIGQQAEFLKEVNDRAIDLIKDVSKLAADVEHLKRQEKPHG